MAGNKDKKYTNKQGATEQDPQREKEHLSGSGERQYDTQQERGFSNEQTDAQRERRREDEQVEDEPM